MISPIGLIRPIRPISKQQRLYFQLIIGSLLVLLIPLAIVITNRPNKAEAAWWPEIGNAWAQRKQLTLTNNSGATLNSTAVVAVSIDTKALYDSRKLRSDCNDLRIIYHNTSSTATELTRHLVYTGGTTCSTSTTTKVNFILQANITNGSSDTNYYLYYSNPHASAPTSTDNAFDISSADALLVCPFDGSTTCAAGETPSTSTGALRYSGSKSALSFDGATDDKVTSAALSSQTSGTIEMWIKPFSADIGTNAEMLINQRSGSTAAGMFQIYGAASNKLTVLVHNGTSWSTNFTTNSSINAQAWNHIALTWDSTNGKKFYINGTLDANTSADTQALFDGTTNILLGLLYDNNWDYNGLIDEVRVSDSIRYTAAFTPSTSPFIRDSNTKLLLHMDENGSDPRNAGKAIDDSGNGNHGTITGAKYVSGLVGVDASSSDTGYMSNQSYGSHQGIFIEEGTTNKITNPSFDHSTYNTNWDGVGGNLTVTENTSAPYYKFGSKSAKIVAAGAISGSSNMDTIGIDPDSTATHTLSAYIYNGTSGAVGGTIDANVAKLVFEGVAQTTTYTDMGGGWWRLTYSAATTDSTNEYGIEVADTKTVYIDGVQLEAKAYATTYTDGTLGTGYAWTSTAHNSTSTRTQGDLRYSSTNNALAAAGTVSFWAKPDFDWNYDPPADVTKAIFSLNAQMGMTIANSIKFRWYDPNNGDPRRIWWDFTESDNTINSGGYTPTAGTVWRMFTITWRAQNDGADYFYVYENTTATVSQTSQSYNFSLTGNLSLGVDHAGNWPANITFSDWKIYNAALSTTQISDLYYAGLLSHSEGTVLDRFSNNKGEDPAGVWHFDDGQGTTAQDSSTNNLDGTLNNTPTWQTEDQCIAGKCLYFDGTNNENVSKSDDSKLDFAASDNFTISAWVRRNGASSANNFIITKAQSGYTGYKLYQDASGDYCFDVSDGTNTDTACTSAVEFDDNQWHYVQGVKSAATSITLYVDGKQRAQDSSIAATGTLANTGTFYIGVDLDGTSNEWLGFIDEVKVYPYARTAQQILTDYNSRGSVQGASIDSGQARMTNLSNGLVGYWKMDEAAANTCTGGVNDSCDSSGNSNNGAWNGDTTSAAGKFGNGVTFDGTGDYTNVPDFALSDTRTFTAWIYPTVIPGSGSYKVIFAKREGMTNGTGLANEWYLYLNGSKLYGVINSTNQAVVVNGGTTITANTWYHVVLQYDQSNLKVFVNGVQDGITSSTISIQDAGTPYHFGDDGDSSRFFAGTMDEVRIYNRALSPAEVSQLYNWAPGPRVELKMEEGKGTSTTDSSGNSRTGTINGNPVWKPGKYGTGIRMDGTGDNIQVGDF